MNAVSDHIRATLELAALASRCIAQTYTRAAAAHQMLKILQKGLETPRTPAGDRYTLAAIREAMRGNTAVPTSALK